jgi:hypothetical protein
MRICAFDLEGTAHGQKDKSRRELLISSPEGVQLLRLTPATLPVSTRLPTECCLACDCLQRSNCELANRTVPQQPVTYLNYG